MRPHGTQEELARRRRRAVEAYHEGRPAATIAEVLGVDRSTVHRWVRQARTPGGLDPKPAPRRPGLDDSQLARLREWLLQGARAHGWADDLWTAARVAALIERRLGVRYHPEHVRKILKRRMRFSSQKPQLRARERDDEEIDRWVDEEFPGIADEARERGAHLVFLDESCFRLTPTVRRTLAPRGETPTLECWDKRDKISAISAITLSPARRRPGLCFRLLPERENFHGEEVVEFLKGLKARLGEFTVIWDRAKIHSRSKVVGEYLSGQPGIVAEDLPAYAPELNPDEMVWCWAKYGRMSNYAPEDLDALRFRVYREMEYLRAHPYALYPMLNHTPLFNAA